MKDIFYLLFLYGISGTLFHELGHMIAATIFGVKILSYKISPISQSFIETEKLNEKEIKTIILRLAGGFFSCLSLLFFLIVFPMNGFLKVFNYKIYVTDLGIFFCITHLVSAFHEAFFYKSYMKNKYYQVLVFPISIIIYLFYFFCL